MADSISLEREYTIPLRKSWSRAQEYKKSAKAIKAIKIFIAKHMKVIDRDVNKVKLDVNLNNDIWFRGRRHPPAKVKVKARKEGEIVHVTFAEVPEIVKFKINRLSKIHKKPEVEKPKEKTESKESAKDKEVKTEEEKKDEQEKEKAVAEHNIKHAEQQAKAQKHTTTSKTPGIHRKALKK